MNTILRSFARAQLLEFTSFAAEPSVSGTFTGDGKPAKLAYLTAIKGEPLDGKDTVILVFTKQDHSNTGKPRSKMGSQFHLSQQSAAVAAPLCGA